MHREILTERDIEDRFRQGTTYLEINENVQLTALAYEKARSLGMQLVNSAGDTNPAAPIRPYLSQSQSVKLAAAALPRGETTQIPFTPPPIQSPPSKTSAQGGLEARIKAAVIAQMGNQVESHLLDQIIQRVLLRTGLK
ncbi:MAG: hypothetical protein PHQ40_21375 [Anaerolineaceae bacterium]|nr:hypothetical protein [Anaerolineaceae bacterium]